MTPVRPITAFILVNRNGWPFPTSTRGSAYQVREWADNEGWRGIGGYKTAKEEGWRVCKVRIVEFASQP